MEKYDLKNDIKVFGTHVKTFPLGIGDAFDALFKMLPDGMQRNYYGISYITDSGEIYYLAGTEEKYTGEAGKYNCETIMIDKGEYLTETVHDWRKNTECIKDVFYQLMQNNEADKSKPCVEWYKTDDEMLCMIKHL